MLIIKALAVFRKSKSGIPPENYNAFSKFSPNFDTPEISVSVIQL